MSDIDIYIYKADVGERRENKDDWLKYLDRQKRKQKLIFIKSKSIYRSSSSLVN